MQKGEQGIQGPVGPRGLQGVRGYPGYKGEVSVYPVYTGTFDWAGPCQVSAAWSNVPMVNAAGLSWERACRVGWLSLFNLSELTWCGSVTSSSVKQVS